MMPVSVKLAVKRGVLPSFISLLSKILRLHILRNVSLKFEFQQGNGELLRRAELSHMLNFLVSLESMPVAMLLFSTNYGVALSLSGVSQQC